MNLWEKRTLRVAGLVLAGLSLAAGCETNVNDEDEAFAVTSRASQDASAKQADGSSSTGGERPPISGDGTFVAFSSSATNLVAGDTNSSTDIFVKNVQTGAIEMISVSSSGGASNGPSKAPRITSDGRYVAFESFATNLVSADTNDMFDIFVRDRTLGETVRASVRDDGSQMSMGSVPAHASISDDGSLVAFDTMQSLTSVDTNAIADVYVWDRSTLKTKIVSKTSGGLIGGGAATGAERPAISGDGTLVAFHSDYSTLIGAADTNMKVDVFISSVATGNTIERVSVFGTSGQASAASLNPWLSPDGRYVAMESQADLSGTGIDNTYILIFVRDRSVQVSLLASASDQGFKASKACFLPSISADGRFAAFSTDSANLVSGDTNEATDIFVRDTVAGTTIRVSVNTFNEQSQGAQFVSGSDIKQKGSSSPSISADGRFVAFVSEATNLVVSDSNGVADVFVRGPLR